VLDIGVSHRLDALWARAPRSPVSIGSGPAGAAPQTSAQGNRESKHPFCCAFSLEDRKLLLNAVGPSFT